MGFQTAAKYWIGVLLLIGSTLNSGAFSLLGPIQPWMQSSNGVIEPGDIGGPMPIGSGYRWNVPVVTYGFDQSFLNFFGSNGVAAVESAIQILNNLPPAYQITLTNYPLSSIQVNYAAQTLGLVDLKSETLSFLLEQLGLAAPTRNIYVLHDLPTNFASAFGSAIEVFGMPIFYESVSGYSGAPEFGAADVTNFVAGFNFDPETWEPSPYVNEDLFSCNIELLGNQFTAISFSVDPLALLDSAIAGNSLSFGVFYTGLSRDDVGGLRYLFSTNNINCEPLLNDVTGLSTNSFVNGAWRPGIDKITFLPQTVGPTPGTFLPMTNDFTDTYITNGLVAQQKLQRVTKQPDFLFSAANDFSCSGTTNWLNDAAQNNHPSGGGPGIIRPPVVITFQKMGRSYASQTGTSEETAQDGTSFAGVFGSLDGSTNAPVIYPTSPTGDISTTVRIQFYSSSSAPSYQLGQTVQWSPTARAGTIYAVQTSTNFTVWNSLFSVTNDGSVCTYYNYSAHSAARFYRLIRQ